MPAAKIQGNPSGFSCTAGLTQRERADLFAILPPGLAETMPFVAMGDRETGQDGQLILASDSFLNLFGAPSLASLNRLLSAGTGRRTKRLADLATSLVLNAPPSIKRLRVGGQPAKTITFLCRRVGSGGSPCRFAGAVLDVSDHRARASHSRQAAPNPGQRDSHVRTPLGGKNERAHLERDLRRQKSAVRELSAILDTATDGVAVLDGQGLILSLNRSGAALFGRDQNEVTGTRFLDLIAAGSQALAADYFQGLKSGGNVSLLNQGCEVTCLASQGGTIPVFMTLGRIGHAAGPGKPEDDRFCAILRDLTHWKKVEQDLEEAREEAERASALKSDFLAKVSHEIRTPLNSILGFAQVMMEERFGPVGTQRYKNYLKDIHSSGGLVMSLVNDLLDLSKIESGKMDFDFASIDANRIVAECVSIMQPQASEEKVAIRLSLSPALPNLLADERSLRQIVLNLLSNAVKFNRPGGQVTVTTALADAGSAVIRIRDTGTGMSESDIGAAFEPFRRLVTARPSSGTGLGLPLTKALIEANQASLTIKSKENEGTLAEVIFPPARILAE